ncbi:MAG: hypothetical protein PF440_03115 [Thiomicrorhabdus sp.]|jgi:hypothetical protein|nr:hypothetical protein [Thiomicrorhabdus sp.]
MNPDDPFIPDHEIFDGFKRAMCFMAIGKKNNFATTKEKRILFYEMIDDDVDEETAIELIKL